MKKFSKLLSVVLSLTVSASMIAPAFAASVADLNDAINGAETGTALDNGHTGYGYNESTSSYGIEAWTENETRNVQLKEEVTNEDKDTITIDENVKLDLNDQKLDLGTERITVDEGGKLTVDDSGENGTIQSENSYAISNKGTLDIQDGTINSDGYAAISNSGQATIGEDADLTGKTAGAVASGGLMKSEGDLTGGKYGIIATGEGASVEVSGGNVDGATAGIQVQRGAEATVSGDATVTSDDTGIIVSGSESTLDVKGGTIQGNKRVINANGTIINSAEDAAKSDQVTITNGTITKYKETKEVDLNNTPEFDGYTTRKFGFGFYVADPSTGNPFPIDEQIELAHNFEYTYSYVIDGVKYVGHEVEWYEVDWHGEISNIGFRFNLPLPDGEKGSIPITFTIKNGTDIVTVIFNDNSTWYPTVVASDGFTINMDHRGRPDTNTEGKLLNIPGGIVYAYLESTYTVTVNYVDEDGNPIAAPVSDETVRYRKGDSYSFESPEVDGYTPGQTVVSGNVEDGNVVVTVVYTANPTPVTPVDPVDPDPVDPGVEIEDPAIPLADGPITRAQFLDYLWRHEGEPASDGVCTFEDVPEDHEFILALAWAEQNGVAEAYFGVEDHEDGTFEPDELVTVAAVREFLGSFAREFGTNAVAPAALTSLSGSDDEAVVNCSEVLAEFFGEEYAAPAQDEELEIAA